MAVNIEIKAYARDYDQQMKLAEDLCTGRKQTIEQVDTFFDVSKGRFKLRKLDSTHGQLVFYTRPDSPGPKRSEYFIFDTDNPDELNIVLSKAIGVRGVVRKVRTLLIIDQTRIHFDEVDGLGKFIELEVVLSEDQPEKQGHMIAEELLLKLNIQEDDLIEGAYIDLVDKFHRNS